MCLIATMSSADHDAPLRAPAPVGRNVRPQTAICASLSRQNTGSATCVKRPHLLRHADDVGVDRQLTDNLVVGANFLYVRGFNQIGTLDYNPVVLSLGAGRRPNDLPCSAPSAAGCASR